MAVNDPHFQKVLVLIRTLNLCSIITPFGDFEISCIRNIMENGAFAHLEQMLHFP